MLTFVLVAIAVSIAALILGGMLGRKLYSFMATQVEETPHARWCRVNGVQY